MSRSCSISFCVCFQHLRGRLVVRDQGLKGGACSLSRGPVVVAPGCAVLLAPLLRLAPHALGPKLLPLLVGHVSHVVSSPSSAASTRVSTSDQRLVLLKTS